MGKLSKNNTQFKKLSTKQMFALEGLALNPDIETVAENIGVGKSTLYNWLRDESFKMKLVEKRTEILDNSIDQIKTYCKTALQKIAGLMESNNEKTVLQAAIYLLDKALEVKQVQEFEERIISIEEIIEMRLTHE